MGSIIDDFEGIADRLRKLKGEPKQPKKLLSEELEKALADSDEAQCQAEPATPPPAYVDCPRCAGSGNYIDPLHLHKVLCNMCGGLGKVQNPNLPHTVSQGRRNVSNQQSRLKCVFCLGRGRRPDPSDPLITEECNYCSGTGYA